MSAPQVFTCQRNLSIQIDTGFLPCVAWTTDATLPEGIDGFSYDEQVIYNAGIPNLTYSKTGGTLPAGVTLSSAGLLSGIPTDDGTFTFEITATDGACVLCAKSFSLVIQPQDPDCGWVQNFDVPGVSPVIFHCAGYKTAIRMEAATLETPGACVDDSPTVAGDVQYSKVFGDYPTLKHFQIRIRGDLKAFTGLSCFATVGNGLLQVIQTNLDDLPAVLLNFQHSIDGNGEPTFVWYGTLQAGLTCTITVFAGLNNSIKDNDLNMAMVEVLIYVTDSPIP